jgi:uncharacterized membrane protein
LVKNKQIVIHLFTLKTIGMNATQIHLALTHVPVILSFVGLVLLIVSFFSKSAVTTKISFYILLIAGLATLPVYFSGEGTEDAVEGLAGVSEGIVEQHEDMAKLALVIIGASGLIALIGLLVYQHVRLVRVIKVFSLVIAIAAAVAMAQTAHLGGQIRHSEIRSGFLATTEAGGDGENAGAAANENDEEDDD